MLQLKPLLVLGDDGKVASLEKIRTTHKAQQRVLEKYIEETKDLNVLTFISHAHNDHAAEWFKSEIQKVFPNRDVIVAPLTPVVGAHTGPKGIGVGFIKL